MLVSTDMIPDSNDALPTIAQSTSDMTAYAPITPIAVRHTVFTALTAAHLIKFFIVSPLFATCTFLSQLKNAPCVVAKCVYSSSISEASFFIFSLASLSTSLNR